MTVRSDITIDWSLSPRVITVSAPSTEVTIQDLYDTLRERESRPYNLAYDEIVSAGGKEALGAGDRVGITLTLLNAVLNFGNRVSQTVVRVTGGNLVAVDAAGDSIDPVGFSTNVLAFIAQASSTTITDLENIQNSAFFGAVTIDTVAGEPGTAFPIGTPERPVGNLVDALTIAQSRGLTVFQIVSALTITGLDFSDGYTFMGDNPTATSVTIDASANVMNCSFRELRVSGTLDADCEFHDCVIASVAGIKGILIACGIEGPLVLSGGGQTTLTKCYSSVAGGGAGQYPQIDMGGSGQKLAIRGYEGGLGIGNCTGADDTSIDMSSGRVVIDADVTAGTFAIRGIADVIDNSTGSAVVTDLTINRYARPVWQRQGLDPDNPLTITDSAINAGDVSQTLTDDGTTTTVTQS